MTKVSYKVLTKDEAGRLHNALLHGKKKELAVYLGMAPSGLSRLLNVGKFGYRMPQSVYEQIQEFMKLNKLDYGKVSATEIPKEK